MESRETASASLPPIFLVTGEFPPDRGGIADYCGRLVEALTGQGVELSALTTDRSSSALSTQHPALSTSRVRRWDARLFRAVAREAPRGAIVHLQYQPAAFGLRGEICLLPLALRVWRPDVRVVTTFHDARVPYLFPKAGPLRWQVVRLLARTSHVVLAADPMDLFALGAPSRRHVWVPIGPNVEPQPPPHYDRAVFRQRLGAGPDDLVVAYFGFQNSSKGLDTLVETFERLRREQPNARLLLLGGATGASDPTDRATAQWLERRIGALAEQVVQPGYLANAELSVHLLAADVALLPYTDGASFRRGSLLACLAHGLPIVTTTGPGLTAQSRPGSGVEGVPLLASSVLAAPPGDPARLAALVRAVGRDAALRSRLQAASARLASALSWDVVAQRHVQAYQRLSPASARVRPH